MTSLAHTLFFFVLALTILIAFHEYGHYWAARRMGVKVLRFSLGFGPVIGRYRKTPEDTEFTLCALPIGGYVKMVDEREGDVAPENLPFAFSQKSVGRRAFIVLAGPLFNFLLAILVYWMAFIWGETGTKPILDTPPLGSLAADAGFEAQDVILKVAGKETPIWNAALTEIIEQALEGIPVSVTVSTVDGRVLERVLHIPVDRAEKPEHLFKVLGFKVYEPDLAPVIERLEPNSSAEQAGFKPGDTVVSADAKPIKTWKEWVNYVRGKPEQTIVAVIERDGVRLSLTVVPKALQTEEGSIGRIGAAVLVPPDIAKSLEVEYRLGVLPALSMAVEKTGQYAFLTLKMVGRMLVGKAAVENLSGPISIAQYAGHSANLGFGQFMKFLALISISLGVLNLLPVPVLDGGHLVFFMIEAVRGRPLSDAAQMRFQQVGMFLLLCLMVLAFYLDIGRLLTP